MPDISQKPGLAIDDLTQPLGQPAASAASARRSAVSLRASLTACACVLGAGAATYVWVRDDGQGGRPRVIVAIEQPQKPVVTALADPMPTGAIPAAPMAAPPRATGEEVENSSGVRVVRQGGGEIPGALIITVPEAPQIGLTPAPDRQLVEKSAHGLIPKIGPSDRRPMDVYSRPIATSAKLPPGAPRIAIMVGGMGLSQNATRHALEKLPPAVTLAFAPYGNALTGQVAGARDKGFEIVLQAPMEPYDLAGDGPGPHMLRTSHDRAELKDHLHWLMSRFPGYVGIGNFLGGKFLADAKSVAPVLEEIGARGLFMIDDGSSNQSLVAKIAGASGAPFIVADVIIDAVREPQAIEKALLQLETVAREKGLATGVATGLPDTVDRISAFARGLERRGIALVPLSAAAGRTPRPTARIRVSPQPQ